MAATALASDISSFPSLLIKSRPCWVIGLYFYATTSKTPCKLELNDKFILLENFLKSMLMRNLQRVLEKCILKENYSWIKISFISKSIYLFIPFPHDFW